MSAKHLEFKTERERKIALATAIKVRNLREERKRQSAPGGLIHYIRYFWHVLEPNTPFVEGKALYAICKHLEAVARGDIKRLLVNCPPGTMKPVHVDELIMTRRGYVRLGDILVGDEVLTHKGRFRRVTAVHEQGVLPLLRVSTFGGRTTRTAPDHPFLTTRGWVAAGALVPGRDYVGTPRVVEPFGDGSMSPEEARLLGYLVGDGSISHRSLSFTSGDVESRTDFIACAAACGFHAQIADCQNAKMNALRVTLKSGEERWGQGKVLCVENGETYQSIRCASEALSIPAGLISQALSKGGRVRDPKKPATYRGAKGKKLATRSGYLTFKRVGEKEVPVLNWLKSHGLYKSNSYTKRIPTGVFSSGPEAIRNFVGAYWSCDGMISVRHQGAKTTMMASATTVSKGLSEDLQRALSLVNISTRIRKTCRNLDSVKQPGGKYEFFNVVTQQRNEVAKFASIPGLLGRKRELAEMAFLDRFEPNIYEDEVLSVDPDGSGECRCLTVDEDQSFTSNGLIVHNSLLCNCFFPSWQWAALKRGDLRYLAFSYSSDLTERDNEKLIHLMDSQEFKEMYSKDVWLTSKGVKKPGNNKRGWKLASSSGGLGTGERGNGILYDDPHNVKDGESKTVTESTVRFFRESMSDRLNNLEDTFIVVIMQRVSEGDVSGCIIENDFDYVHLCIPALYEPDRHCTTYVNGKQFWTDWRTKEGDPYWPERFSLEALAALRKVKGEYAWAGQYQQRPEVRGGGLFKREDWQDWTDPKWPKFSYIIASLDPAFTAKQANDPSGFTIWGCFSHEGEDCAILLHAWRKWLPLHGPDVDRQPGETDDDYRERCRPTWGLVETVAEDCRRFKCARLLIENKASGHDVSTEMHRLHTGRTAYTFVDPKGLDKHARCVRVQPEFSNGQIWARTEKKYAQLVIDEMAIFPKGKYDDLCDSSTQVIFWLRNHGFLKRRSEKIREQVNSASKYHQPKVLYEC